ncbi:MAG TPA: hypothetical protein VNL15_05475 [Dehalococcoidia bacterium]|nr:hypothetical protein [Dehalococcoidia bacterium]
MHPLDDAYQRIKAAKKDLANLKRVCERIEKAKRESVSIEQEPQRIIYLPNGQRLAFGGLHVRTGEVEVPANVADKVGAIVYRLRASLDYLIYELAILDSGRVQYGTQFPIEDGEDVFWSKRNTLLKGVSDEHVAAIKRLQPCDGCEWTRRLRILSNPDKHRKLTAVLGQSGVDLLTAPTIKTAQGRVIDWSRVNVNPQAVAVISFDDGTPVIQTLQQLLSQVTNVLDQFKPEFQ